ncbi:MAG: carbon starvation protein A [Armatimonadota bacterium]
MSSALLAVLILASLYLGYRYYGRHLEQRAVEPDADAPVPATAQRDGIDYEPARPIVLFGHHFSSIAGAAPIIGPALALCVFGWVPSILWIILGVIFIGAMHDYLTLMVSARHRGVSVAEVAETYLGSRASGGFAVFLWLALILVIAVFGVLGAKTLIANPQMVIPTLGIIPLAMVFGWGLRSGKLGVGWGSLAAGIGLAALIGIGYYRPLALPDALFGYELPDQAQVNIWFGILMVYCLVASLLPVWLLLRPRDYLSTFQLFAGLGLGFVCVLLANRALEAPAYLGFQSAKGPLWPMLFVIIACGAVSGFHAVIASGTTSKQLPNETAGRPIGYGAMVMEAVLGGLALLVIGGGLYWSGAHTTPGGASLVAPDIVLGKEGAIVAFSRGFGTVVSDALAFIPFALAALFGAIMLKTFILTSLDTCTRLARFVVTESLGDRVSLCRSRLFATIVTIVPAAYLGLSGGWTTIWPVFGAANQLIAALTLLVVSAYLLHARKPSIYAAVPAVFMVCTTIGALVYTGYGFLTNEGGPRWLLAVVAAALAALALYVVAAAVPRLLALRGERPVPETETKKAG